LTSAIATGADLPTVIAALETQQRQQTELRARLETARMPRPELDSAEVRAELEGYIADWKGLLRGHVHQGQQILRQLIIGRLTMMPQQARGLAKPYYTFTGRGTIRPLLGGTIRKLASPRGTSNMYSPLRGWLRRAA
jgi:hypothetical protein